MRGDDALLVEPDPIGDVETLIGERLFASVTLDPGADQVESYEIQLAPRSEEDSPAWNEPLWDIHGGPLIPRPVVRFMTLDGCLAEKGMVVGSRQPVVRLESSQDIATFRWNLRQFGEIIDSADETVEGVSDDRRCIIFTPARPIARRGRPRLGFFFPPFDRRDGWYNGRTYGEEVIPSGLPHHAYAVDFNLDRGDDRGRPVLAAAKGVVESVDDADGTVKITHWNQRLMTQYTHLQDISVRKGDRVELLQQIGEIGRTGTPSAHLHHVHWRRNRAGEWVPRKMRFGRVPYEASLAGPRIPGQDPADWRGPAGVGTSSNVLFGRRLRGWHTEPDARLKVWVRLADGQELLRRLPFQVGKVARNFPPCEDVGCTEDGIAPTTRIDQVFDAEAEPAPGEYSLRYRVTDDDGNVSDWAYDHSVVVSGRDPQ